MQTEKREFKAEIAEMMNLVVNSLYSKKEIFLRELISNASDAIDKAKFKALTDASLAADNPEWAIEIAVDNKAGTLMVSDNGIGMDLEELERNLGTIASSGTKAFRKALQEDKGADLPELIGQFGVGFYAAFMVADKVRVVSRRRGGDAAFMWESEMTGGYSVGESERDGFGTSVMLHLRDEQKEFLDEWRIRELVRKYSDFIAYPVRFRRIDAPEGEKEEDRKRREENEAKALNTMTALWKRAKKDVKEGEYAEFYKHLTHDWKEPLETIPFSGEGAVEFKALLFLPREAGMEMYMPQTKKGLSLYVRNVFIGDDMEMLLPDYLRFVKGVVDSSDLPLNVSREMLQDDAVIAKIKSAVTAKVLSTLEELKKKSADVKEGETPAWRTFWDSFGCILKEGVHTDYANADRIKGLLMYPSAKNADGKLVSLGEYVKDMAPGQDSIYYLCAQKVETARVSPQIEQALKHKCDVLFFCDPVDEWLSESLREFEGKKFVDIARGDVQFGTETEREAEKSANEKAAAELKPLMDAMKTRLEADLAEVRLSTRLSDSPCCLVATEHGMSPAMERMMRAMNKDAPKEKRVLELNAAHPLVAKMKNLSGEKLDEAVDLLYAQALVAEGSPVPDPARFAKLLVSLMLKD